MFKLNPKKEGFVSDIFGGSSGSGAAQAASDAGVREIRRQFNITQGNIEPFLEAGAAALPLVTEGTTAEGLDARLGRIFNTDTFSNLVGETERGALGALAATGLTRNGQAIQDFAQIRPNLGLQLEDLLTSRARNLSSTGLSAATGLGGFGAQAAGNISNLTSQGILGAQQAQAAGSQNLLNTAATIGSIFFSDPDLKENIEVIGYIGDLPIVQWDWIETIQDSALIDSEMNIGFLTTDVEKEFPQHVYHYCGFDCIDYDSLLTELEGQWQVH